MKLRDELVQVAAVAIAWIEQLDLEAMDAVYAIETGAMDIIQEDIESERRRQDARWGSGRIVHPLTMLGVLAEEVGEVAQEVGWHPDPHHDLNQAKRSLADAEYWARRVLDA